MNTKKVNIKGKTLVLFFCNLGSHNHKILFLLNFLFALLYILSFLKSKGYFTYIKLIFFSLNIYSIPTNS